MKRILQHARHNAIAYLALFISIGGTSYAAVTLPANSVGTRQLRNHSITPIKFDRRSVGAYVRAWAVIGPNGRIIDARPAGARVVAWDPGFDVGSIRWPGLSLRCSALASATDGFVRTAVLPGPGKHATLQFQTYDAYGRPTSEETTLAVLCTTP